MEEKQKSDYKICIWGITVSKLEANRIGLAIIFGLAGAVLSMIFLGPQDKVITFLISLVLAAFGYFGIGKKLFENKRKT